MHYLPISFVTWVVTRYFRERLFEDPSNGFYLKSRRKNKTFVLKVGVCWGIRFLHISRCANFFGKHVHLEMPRKQRRKATGSKENSGESSAYISQEISTGKAQDL